MNLVRFKLTTNLPVERFKNLTLEMRQHTLIIVDGDEFSYFCEKHNYYYELDEHCSQCESEENLTGEINMSRIKVSKTAAKAEAKKHKDWPAVVYFWALGLALFSYLIARFALDGYPHPYHWLSGLAGGLIGIPIGWIWYRWRGDVF